jgi:hypothetical protein
MIAAPAGLDVRRLTLQPAAAEAASVNISFEVFFNTLQPYGSWIRTDRHPYVFVPANVGPDWAPYTRGHWIYTERFGWYFESDEPFAWATYHYGRWAYSQDIGWYWVPGTRWAPAWVTWRRGDNYVGWAAIPPEGDGYAVDVDVRVGDVPQGYWYFVPASQFFAPRLDVVVQRGDRDPDAFNRTKLAGPVVIQNNIVVNTVIDLNFIEQQTKQKVEARKVEEVSDPKQAAGPGGNDQPIRAFTAALEPPKPDAKPAQVVDAKAAKAKQDQGGEAAAVAQPAAPAADCKPGADGKLPANCPPASGEATDQNKAADQGKAGAAAKVETKPAAGAADQTKAGAAAEVEAGKPAGAVTDAGKAAAAAKVEPKPVTGAMTDQGKAGATAKVEAGKPAEGAAKAEGQASGEPAKGVPAGARKCTAEQLKADPKACAANAGGPPKGTPAADAAPQQPLVGQTGSIAKGGAEPDTAAAGKPVDNGGGGKCTKALKDARKC